LYKKNCNIIFLQQRNSSNPVCLADLEEHKKILKLILSEKDGKTCRPNQHILSRPIDVV